MDKNVKPYKQKGDTCAIVCMLMVLEFYKKIEKVNWYDERRLYRIYGSKYMSGTPFSAIAYHMSKNGLNTTIYHEDKNLFNNNKNIMDMNIFNLAMNEYKEYLTYAEKEGTRILKGINIDVNILKEELKKGSLIILAGSIKKSYHAILLTGYDNENFKVCDPLYKTKQTRTYNEIEQFMSTNIGKWFIAVNDKNT